MLGKQKPNQSIRPYLLTQCFRGEFQIRQGDWKYLDHLGSGGNNYSRGNMVQYAGPAELEGADAQLYQLTTDPEAVPFERRRLTLDVGRRPHDDRHVAVVLRGVLELDVADEAVVGRHEALLAHLGIGEFDALVHDYGVSVGQELLARQQDTLQSLRGEMLTEGIEILNHDRLSSGRTFVRLCSAAKAAAGAAASATATGGEARPE